MLTMARPAGQSACGSLVDGTGRHRSSARQLKA